MKNGRQTGRPGFALIKSRRPDAHKPDVAPSPECRRFGIGYVLLDVVSHIDASGRFHQIDSLTLRRLQI